MLIPIVSDVFVADLDMACCRFKSALLPFQKRFVADSKAHIVAKRYANRLFATDYRTVGLMRSKH